jgi:hypothetical protein
VRVSRIGERDELVRDRDRLVPVAVEVRKIRALCFCIEDVSAEAITLAHIHPPSPRLTRFVETRKEMELGAQVAVPDRDHLGGARRLGDPNAVLDFVEPGRLSEAAVTAPDEDVETSALLVHPERFDERKRIDSDRDRLLVATGEHVETALVGEDLRARPRARELRDGVEHFRHVSVRRAPIAAEP